MMSSWIVRLEIVTPSYSQTMAVSSHVAYFVMCAPSSMHQCAREREREAHAAFVDPADGNTTRPFCRTGDNLAFPIASSKLKNLKQLLLKAARKLFRSQVVLITAFSSARIKRERRRSGLSDAVGRDNSAVCQKKSPGGTHSAITRAVLLL